MAYAEIGEMITQDAGLRAGRPIIAGTGTCVRTIANDSNRGLSPEQIAAERSHLTLAQVYAALSFYHANKADIDADIAAEDAAYNEAAGAAR